MSGLAFGIVTPYNQISSSSLGNAELKSLFSPTKRHAYVDHTSLGSPGDYSPHIGPPWPSRPSHLALVAASLAIRSNTDDAIDGSRTGILIDRIHGPSIEISEFLMPYLKEGFSGLSPVKFSQTVSNAPVGVLSRAFRISGPGLLFSDLNAVPAAQLKLRAGVIDRALCVGLNSIDEAVVHAIGKRGLFSGWGRSVGFCEFCIAALIERSATPPTYFNVQNTSEGIEGYPALAEAALERLIDRAAINDSEPVVLVLYVPDVSQTNFMAREIGRRLNVERVVDVVNDFGLIFSAAGVLVEVVSTHIKRREAHKRILSIVQDYSGGYIVSVR